MLSLIGIGVSDPDDITVKGLKAVQAADTVYLEEYTSLLQCSVEELADFYKKPVQPVNRDFVESGDELLDEAETNNVAVLIIGDVFGATTHMDIYQRARERKIPTNVIHNASIMNIIGCTGLQLYKFGKTTSIPFRNQDVQGPYNVYQANKDQGAHTLFLLDIKHEEQRYMTVNQALNYLLSMGLPENELCVGCARLGSPTAVIKTGTANELKDEDFGDPLHCLIIPGTLHFAEEEVLDLWRVRNQ